MKDKFQSPTPKPKVKSQNQPPKATNQGSYFAARDEDNLAKIRQIVAALPPFVREFFVGIQLKTTPLTRLNYAYDLRIFFDYLSKNVFEMPPETIKISDLERLDAYDIELFLDYLSSYTFNNKKIKSNNTGKERKLSTIRSFFKYFFKKDKLTKNVTTKVDMPKLKDNPIVKLEPDEVAKLLNKIDSDGDEVTGLTKKQRAFHDRLKVRDNAIFTLFLGTGIRISELVGLNKSDIHFETNSFLVTRKGGSKSVLYFGDEIETSLKNYINFIQNEIENGTSLGMRVADGGGFEGGSALFLSLQGKRITVRAVENLVKKYAALVTPKKITPHKLRSTFGTELYKNTQDIYVVADVLGHKDINTTKKHYAAISDEIRKNAAKTVRLRDESGDE